MELILFFPVTRLVFPHTTRTNARAVGGHLVWPYRLTEVQTAALRVRDLPRASLPVSHVLFPLSDCHVSLVPFSCFELECSFLLVLLNSWFSLPLLSFPVTHPFINSSVHTRVFG